MRPVVFFLLTFLSLHGFAQIDTAFIKRIKALDTADLLKMDTVAAPNDRLTEKIKQLRNEKHGISIETVLQIKIREEQEKDSTKSKEFYSKLLTEVTNGHTAKLIENSVINMYRRTFDEAEIDELIRFYKTTAGKKMDAEFILLLVQSVKDAEQLLKLAAAMIGNGQ